MPDGLTAIQPDFRHELLSFIKRNGGATIQRLADHFEMTHEGVRKQLGILEGEGWIASRAAPSTAAGRGRPARYYGLTRAGEHRFPKHYDQLAINLLDTLLEQAGAEGLKKLLGAVTEKQVAKWKPLLEGKSLPERLKLLKGLYFAGDPFMEIERRGDEIRLIENNCPFLNVATKQPALCSLSISTLQSLLGVRVVREEKFQEGAGRCVFRVMAGVPVAKGFELEAKPAVA